jgi:ketosteroid isomerase-like protein
MITFGNEKVLYKVLLGPYTSKKKAQHEVQVLSQKEKLKAIIIPAIYPPKGQSDPEAAAKVKPKPKPKAPENPPAQTSKPTPAPETVAAKNKKNGSAKTASSPKAKDRKKSVPKKAEYDSVDVVVSMFLAWLKAWQGNDADSYLLFYSNSFKYSGNSLEAWKKARRYALENNKNIAINFSDIQILQGKDTVEISFVQQYKSDKHSDRGHKTLVWKKEGDVWRIVREDWLPV